MDYGSGIAPSPRRPDIHERIKALRDRAVKLEPQVRTLVIISSIIILLSALLAPIRIFTISAGAFGNAPSPMGLSSMMVILLVMVVIVVLMMLALGAYAIFVLTKVGTAFKRRYSTAADELYNSSLGIMIATEDHLRQITEVFRNNWFMQLTKPFKQPDKLEDHLEFCACMFDSLMVRQYTATEVPRMTANRDFQGFTNRRLVSQDSKVYWIGGCVGCVFTNLLWVVAIVFTCSGLRLVGNLGVLAAICDFIMQDVPDPEETVTDTPRTAR